ncbi:hypothetical protein ABBQ38_005677 [Trebouxia sp. C0009 RCD-2024]
MNQRTHPSEEKHFTLTKRHSHMKVKIKLAIKMSDRQNTVAAQEVQPPKPGVLSDSVAEEEQHRPDLASSQCEKPPKPIHTRTVLSSQCVPSTAQGHYIVRDAHGGNFHHLHAS